MRIIMGIVISVIARLRWLRWLLVGVFIFFLLFGWLIGLVAFGMGFYATTLMEAQMQSPVQMSTSTFPVDGTDYQLIVLFPSKVTPGIPTQVEVWVTCPDPNKCDDVRVTAVSKLPFMLKSADDVLILKPILNGKMPKPSEKSVLAYDIIPENRILPQTKIDFLVEIPNTKISQTFAVDTILDSLSLQRTIFVGKIAWLMGLLGSAITPLVVAFIFRRR